MKVLLTTLNSKFVHSNLALRYLKVCLENYIKKCEIALKEYTINDNLQSVLASIYMIEADIYAFSCYIWNVEQIMQICGNLKKVKPNAIIILGGPEVSYDSAKIINDKPFIDFVISGEGEKSLPQLVSKIISKDMEYQEIDGLFFRDSEGKVQNNPTFIIEDLSEILSPFQNDLAEYKNKAAYYESSRGCPYNCSYCLSSTIKGVRYFPMERVKKDLKNLIDAGAMQVKFVDRTFNSSKERAMEIWKYILENNKDTIFHFEIGAHLLDDEMLKFLRHIPNGMFEFEIGIQSTNELTINKINRNTDFEKIKKIVTILTGYNNIHIHLDLIAGLPHEDFKSFEKSFNDVYSLKPHMLQLGFLKMLKGSKIRQESKIYGYEFTSNPPYEVLSTSFLSYQEVIKIKKIEEMLEIYSNSGRYENTLDYVISKYNNSFKFFEELSDYWYCRNDDSRKIPQEENYDILFEFLMNILQKDIGEIRELLKLDFILNNFGAKSRYWMVRYVFNDMKAEIRNMLNTSDFIKKYCPQLLELQLQEKIKSVHFEIIKRSNEMYRLILIERKPNSRGIIKSSFQIVGDEYLKNKQINEQKTS
ncbi:MAG: DUF4080 domain-containing protein [Ignavibacteriales bacterium]